MRISSMCEYMRWRYTMEARYAKCGGDSCCRRLEEDVSNWGRGEWVLCEVHELIIVLMN